MSFLTTEERDEAIRKDLKHSAETWKWRFNFPKKPNYSNIYYYKKSKKIFNAPCYDLEVDRAPDTYKIQHYKIRNNFQESDSRLKYAKEEAKAKKADLLRQWEELEVKEQELRQNFSTFEMFVQKNMAKRARAERKYQQMKLMSGDYIEKIENLKTNIAQIKDTIASMNRMRKSYEFYEEFLQRVVESANFRNIEHLINRFLLLVETKKHLATFMVTTNEHFTFKHNRYVDNLENFQLTHVGLSNELSNLRRNYDQVLGKTSKWEKIIREIWIKYDERISGLSWTKMALRHMFEIAYHRLQHRVDVKEEDSERLRQIDTALRALEKIEMKLSAIQSQENGPTSLAPAEGYFETRAVPDISAGRKKVPAESDDIFASWSDAGATKSLDTTAVDVKSEKNEAYEEYIPIKLATVKWKAANVKNFEYRYRKSLSDIREAKIRERLDGKGLQPKDSSSFKAKWTAAAVAQKLADGGSMISSPAPTVFKVMAELGESASHGVYMLQEEELEDMPKPDVRKIIEKKFETYSMQKKRKKSQHNLPHIAGVTVKGKTTYEKTFAKNEKFLPPIYSKY